MFAGASGFMIGNYLTTQGRNITMDMDMLTDYQANSGQ
jgi:biotin synthase-like enzyme